MDKHQKRFLFYIEWYYRNYGDEWNIQDFPSEIKSKVDKIRPILVELESKGIIKMIGKDKFKIFKLPSDFYQIP
ncbi:MAG: hypothetical protein WBP45_07105 [Daejeonella sp.]